MTLADALASVARLCPPDVYATLAAALRGPSGGHRIGALAPRRAVVEEQAATGSDPRAELEETPTRRERRPSSTSQQIAAVTRDLREMSDTLAASLERKP